MRVNVRVVFKVNIRIVLGENVSVDFKVTARAFIKNEYSSCYKNENMSAF